MDTRTSLGSLLLLAGIAAAPEVLTMDYPATQVENASNTYHNEVVTDRYQWLENWNSDAVKAWSRSQNEFARRYLDALPRRDDIAARVEQVTGGETVSYFSGQRLGERAFFIKYQPPREQTFLVELAADGSGERTIFDPTIFDASGATSIEWYRVSPDGKLLAVALMEGGAEVAALHLFDIANGKPVDEIVPRVNAPTAGGDMAWLPDSSGFFYTRYPRPGERDEKELFFHQELWFRALGTPLSADRYEIGREFDRIAEIRLALEQTSRRLLLNMQYGDSGRFQLHLRDSKGHWHQLTEYGDEIQQAVFLNPHQLLALSRKGAPPKFSAG